MDMTQLLVLFEPWYIVVLVLGALAYFWYRSTYWEHEARRYTLEEHIRTSLLNIASAPRDVCDDDEYEEWLRAAGMGSILDIDTLQEQYVVAKEYASLPFGWERRGEHGPTLLVVGVCEQDTHHVTILPKFIVYYATSQPGQPVRREPKIDGTQLHEVRALDGSWHLITEEQAQQLICRAHSS